MSDSDPITRLNAALEGRYCIESELGEGGMAGVYLVDEGPAVRTESGCPARDTIVYVEEA